MDLPSLLDESSEDSKKSGFERLRDESIKNYYGSFLTERQAGKYFRNPIIIHQPLREVGGDGFWFYYANGSVFLIAFDCMGHGRLASILTRFYLRAISQTVVENEVFDPCQILMAIHQSAQVHFKVGREASAEIAVVRWDIRNPNRIEYAGAGMDLLQIANGEAVRIRADKLGAGDKFEFERDYKTQIISLSDTSTRFFVYSDGATDLFGGPKNKKLGYKKLSEILAETDGLDHLEAKKAILSGLESWVGLNEPVDDLLLIGFEI